MVPELHLPDSANAYVTSDTYAPLYMLSWGKPTVATPCVCPTFPKLPLVEGETPKAWEANKSHEEMGPCSLITGRANKLLLEGIHGATGGLVIYSTKGLGWTLGSSQNRILKVN